MDGHRVSQVRIAIEESLDIISAHRFVREARARRLSREQCQRWILCAGRESKAMPDALGKPRPHRYVHLLRDIGLSEAEISDYDEKAGIRFSLELAYNVSAQPDLAVAIGYRFVNEAVTPIIHGAVELAMRHCYPGLTSDFFKTDVEVGAARIVHLSEAVGRLDNAEQDSVLFGVNLGERSTAALLDEALGLFADWPRGPEASLRPTG